METWGAPGNPSFRTEGVRKRGSLNRLEELPVETFYGK